MNPWWYLNSHSLNHLRCSLTHHKVAVCRPYPLDLNPTLIQWSRRLFVL